MSTYPPTSEDLRAAYELFERENPTLWRLCYPRIYEEPKSGQYYSPKEPARQLFGITAKLEMGMIGESEKYEFMVASHLVKYGVPMFWLGADMALAIRKTTPPGDIHWYDMPMPFPACVFMMPKGSIVHPTEGDLAFIAYGRFRRGESHVSRLIPGMPYGSEQGGMTFMAITVKGLHLFHWNLPLDAYGPSLTIPDVEAIAANFKPEEEHGTGFSFINQPHMTPEDNMLMVEVVHYVFGAILLMNDRPDLVTTGQLRKKVEKKGKPTREFWSPNVLGEHYKIRREHVDQGGAHASPRFHWVRGFHKQQAYGPGHELRKRQWIEPYTRGI